MTTSKDFLCFPGPRRYLYNGEQFMTAMDCVDGTAWGAAPDTAFVQQYWQQGPDGKWYPDGKTSCIMTAVSFALIDGIWCVTDENQFAPNPQGRPFRKFNLNYGSACKFTPMKLEDAPSRIVSGGAANWSQFDESGHVVNSAHGIDWNYNVINNRSGSLTEIYFQDPVPDGKVDFEDLAYCKNTLMQVGLGDVVLTDLLTGTSCKQRL